MKYSQYSKTQLENELSSVMAKLSEYKASGIKLDMSRGKPGPDQLVLSQDMLGCIKKPADCITENGFDCRNYGLLDGIPEAKKLFADILDVPVENVIVTGNSSLNIMYDELVRAMLYGVAGGKSPWKDLPKVKFICPVPGYDRHFAICAALGIEMITVPMTKDGPDMNKVASLCADDESVKGIWCVPKYSNPDGIVYSDDTVRAFASLKPAASDFRIFWDNAYVVHPLEGEPAVQLNLFTEAIKYDNENMPLIFTSTSKISFPGSGVAVMAASNENIAHTKKYMGIQTIGYDKLNQMRHVKFFGSAEGILNQMKKHAACVKPKFETVLLELESLAPLGIAEWNSPKGGYFISLDVMDGCAKRAYELAKDTGVTLTKVGDTFPYGKDPRDRNIRIAPTYPSAAELKSAAAILCLCVRAAAAELLLSSGSVK